MEGRLPSLINYLQDFSIPPSTHDRNDTVKPVIPDFQHVDQFDYQAKRTSLSPMNGMQQCSFTVQLHQSNKQHELEWHSVLA